MKRILLVDDDPLVLGTLREALDGAGYAVATAENGKQAMQELSRARTDLVVTDLIMPTQEGVETIMAVRKAYPTLPIIAISGGGRLDALSLLDVARKFGAAATLKKPFPPSVLVTLIGRILAERRGGESC
ncbi:response regulator [Minwuia thermotolerans]|uniref:Response regulator n=1 Tax=Minwuia thermotolerans TaxID=2056226 RepID=A0A2M9FWZ2_9PROT|nr:response regulator [Minwuia thermotolerans]PJK27977.1 response regulator [Minwuia thermotolerans]